MFKNMILILVDAIKKDPFFKLLKTIRCAIDIAEYGYTIEEEECELGNSHKKYVLYMHIPPIVGFRKSVKTPRHMIYINTKGPRNAI